MNQLANKEVRMTSVELTELINEFREIEGGKSELLHKTLLEKIRTNKQSSYRYLSQMRRSIDR
jgi:hypothetical protein